MSNATVVGRDVVLGYSGQIVVDKSDFTVPPGAITAVIGPNGSGKSTLLAAIAGLNTPLGGAIEFPRTGVDRSRISYVLQTTKVNESLPITVKEVVTMGRYSTVGRFGRLSTEDRDAVNQAMDRVDIHPLSRRHINRLSGGQRQRVFVAQGLVQNHDILLLDEPLTGIDLVTAKAIDDVIHDEINEGCSVVLTTHDLSEAQIADHVILLAGRVVAQGSPEDVLTSENLAKAYGHALLHIEDDVVMLDDPAHIPVAGRHQHRSIGHPESNPDDHHSS